MLRREVITMIGGAVAAWPLTASGQQAMPVIGYLSPGSPESDALRLTGLRQGLNDTGYVAGQSVAIEFRWAEGQHDRLPELATDLVRRQVAVIAAAGVPPALAAKAATATIPIVFGVAVDPVELGLVTSLNRPGGNVTGVTNLNVEVGPKRVELLRELLPSATLIAVLVNPTNPTIGEPFVRDLQAAAGTLGLKLQVLHASTERDFDTVFATLAQLQAGALVISPDQFLTSRIEQLAQLTLLHGIPAISQLRQFTAAGGLMSYGSSETEYYRPIGIYAGRILKGEKPSDLPVQRSAIVELIINLKTARILGLTIPLPLVGRADEVIE
jgi:putative tryptophan/tyrosine transport system substrate-binding protein